jgi:hypothetical protein
MKEIWVEIAGKLKLYPWISQALERRAASSPLRSTTTDVSFLVCIYTQNIITKYSHNCFHICKKKKKLLSVVLILKGKLLNCPEPTSKNLEQQELLSTGFHTHTAVIFPHINSTTPFSLVLHPKKTLQEESEYLVNKMVSKVWQQ